MKRVLVVDDEPGQRRLLAAVLGRHGYHVVPAASGQDALRLAGEAAPDLVLLDIVMPGLDGWQTCRAIRAMSDVPIIIMTGQRREEADVVRGLECGADDYLRKPVGNHELLARVRAALRRVARAPYVGEPKPPGFYDGYLSVDVPSRRVAVAGRALKLTRREFSLLAALLEYPDRVLTHRQLLENVWGWEYANDVDYVRVYVSHLRRKLEPDASRPRYILTEPGVGYRFCTGQLEPPAPSGRHVATG